VKRLILIATLFMAVISCSRSSEVANNEKVAKAEKELRQLERSLITAVQRKDTETLSRIWSDEYLGTAPDGRVVSKNDLLAAVKGGAIEIESMELDDLRLRLFGDVAVLTGRADVKAAVDKEDYSGSYRGTGIFIKRAGHWEVIGVLVGPMKRCP